MDPKHFGKNYSYLGPGTQILTREQLHDNVPLNKLDEAAKKHDYAYQHEKEEYLKDHDKNKHINKIWNYDEEFINEAQNQNDDPIMGKISAKLIQAKRYAEQNGYPTEKFSGFGKKKHIDPMHRLKMMVIKNYKNIDTKEHKKKKLLGDFLQH